MGKGCAARALTAIPDVPDAGSIFLNRAFNRAVAEADTNKDGHITEVEARIFAGAH